MIHERGEGMVMAMRTANDDHDDNNDGGNATIKWYTKEEKGW